LDSDLGHHKSIWRSPPMFSPGDLPRINVPISNGP
jgi:hypothetical protein